VLVEQEDCPVGDCNVAAAAVMQGVRAVDLVSFSCARTPLSIAARSPR
jgi:hypothetical protein